MAYLFMTEDDDYVDGTWEPDGGENAVILQPGIHDGPTVPTAEGPTLYRMVERAGNPRREAEPCEFAVAPAVGSDAGYPNQVGGSPTFLQSEEYPPGGPWKLLLQIDSGTVPFHVNFGDVGVGYAFISEDGRSAKFLWQCC